MADFFDKLIAIALEAGNAVKDAGAAVADKGGAVMESTRQRVERVKLESEREKAYRTLGESFYTMFDSGVLNVSELKNRCQDLRTLNRQIEELELLAAQKEAGETPGRGASDDKEDPENSDNESHAE